MKSGKSDTFNRAEKFLRCNSMGFECLSERVSWDCKVGGMVVSSVVMALREMVTDDVAGSRGIVGGTVETVKPD